MSREMKSSDIEWVNSIPNEWRETKLSRVSARITDFVASGSFADLNENVKYLDRPDYAMLVRTADLSGTRSNTVYINKHAYNFLSNSNLHGGEIILSNIGSVGSVFMYEPMYERASLAPNAIMVDKTPCNRYYYYYFQCTGAGAELRTIGGSSVQTKFNKTQLRALKVVVPPLSEQHQIVSFLDRKCSAIDTAIEKTKKSIEKLEEYKKAVITKAVTKGLDPDAKMKNSGIEWIGEVPETWDVIKTKYLFRILKRIAGKEGYDVISITQGGLKIKDTKSNEGQLAENYSNYQFVFPGDFAMNHMDLLTGWVDLSVLSGVTSPDYRVFRRIKDSTNNDYYKYLFQSLYFNKIYYGKAQGVAEVGRKRLQAPVFKEIKLPYPPAEEQTKIAEYIQDKCFSIDALITKKQEAINKWEEYKKSLIYHAVTGKIDCRNEVV